MKYITPTLETERLILKRGSKKDYQEVYEYDFTKLRNINGEFKYVKTLEKDIDGFDTYADTEDEVFDWIIYLKNGTPIANITADREEKDIKAIEISFNMHPNYWRQGYMQESIIKVLEYLFTQEFDNVLSGYSEGNINSQYLQEKLGFQMYKVIQNAWIKDNISITDYKTIMPKEQFLKLYGHNRKKF